ncbi:hypothetical protein H7A76_31315 [Pseudomonas sp. MSSRFD41]|uniref:hypothetical protein n=1 Tax=Pseudomonas sp. MSSRFD41 TaxID=1310370 RepID=UPI00163A8ADF|nr:hypothetical protein [Pseudomonas sp. MSSRFD41]MBC2659941.1 hypothetical protein [Pseudomonas sp. MSSRFD41]
MLEELNITPQQALQQTAQTLIALSKVLAKIAPGITQIQLELAVEACLAEGCGSELPEAILEKVFKGAAPATVLKPEEFDNKLQDTSQKS